MTIGWYGLIVYIAVKLLSVNCKRISTDISQYSLVYMIVVDSH